MAGYGPDYPLWQDINFTPDWVYQRIQKRSAVGQAPISPALYHPLPSASGSPALWGITDKAWNEEEDALVMYAQSSDGKREGLTYKNVAAALGRSECSRAWTGYMLAVGRTVGAVKSRWFREIKPWRESVPAYQANKKIQEGKRLAFEKYKYPTSRLDAL